MRIDHLILFTDDVRASANFFCELLGFTETDDDPGAKEGLVIHSDETDIVILKVAADRLPNPYHFAFEAKTRDQFDTIYKLALSKNLAPRIMPDKKSEQGLGELTRSGQSMTHFYMDAPSGSLIEVLHRSSS